MARAIALWHPWRCKPSHRPRRCLPQCLHYCAQKQWRAGTVRRASSRIPLPRNAVPHVTPHWRQGVHTVGSRPPSRRPFVPSVANALLGLLPCPPASRQPIPRHRSLRPRRPSLSVVPTLPEGERKLVTRHCLRRSRCSSSGPAFAVQRSLSLSLLWRSGSVCTLVTSS